MSMPVADTNALFKLAATEPRKILEKLTADPSIANIKDEDERLLIHHACLAKNDELVDALIQANKNVDAQDDQGYTALLICVLTGYMGGVQRLVSAGADVNLAASSGVTPLHSSVSKGHIEILEYLLKHDASVYATDRYRQTPLFRAASTGSALGVKLLLNHDAKVNATDSTNSTPLHFAIENQHGDIAVMLLRHGADPEIVNQDGKKAERMTNNIKVIEYIASEGKK